MKDWLVIVSCGLYICLEAYLAFLGKKKGWLKGEGGRKFIHMATSLLVFPVLFAIDEPVLRLLGPSVFIVFNAAATFSGMGRIIGLNDDKRHLGLVIYPFSVLLLVILSNRGVISPFSAASGVMVMGLGDGMAALIGTKFGRHSYKVKWSGKKSVEGSTAMFLVSLLSILLIARCPFWVALFVSAAATCAENLSPSSVDNLTVPLLTSFVLEALCAL